MKSRTSESDDALGPLPAPKDFSLVLGGPLFQLLCRARLSDDGLLLVRRRIVIISLLAWLPLLVLSALEGHALGGSESVDFLRDLEVHIRFLVVMPLLIAAEIVVHQRMRTVVTLFLARGLIPQSAMARFGAAIASAFRLRNSVLAEVLMIALVYGVGILIIWRQYLVLDTATWYATPSAGHTELSLAGMWYAYVSMPLFQFLLLRWYFRILIWSRFLWQVSRIDLSLVPTHPDRFGGLGFLSNISYAFAPLAVAHGGLLAGLLANRIFFLGTGLADYKTEIAVVVVFMLCVFICPLLVFSTQLAQARRAGILEYGTQTALYLRQGDAASPGGGADDPSLASAGANYDAVQAIRIMPVTREAVVQLILATVAPILPLALTMMPLADLVKTLLGVIF